MDWKAHATLISRHKTPKERIHILKGIYGQQPAKRRLHLINEQKKEDQREQTNSLYPLCQRNEESQNYIFQCPQIRTHNFRIKSLQSLNGYHQRRNTFSPVTKLLTKNLHHWMETLPQKPVTVTQIQTDFLTPT